MARLDPDLMVAVVLQDDGLRMMAVAGPFVNTGGLDIKPVAHTQSAMGCPDLVVYLQPDRIRIAVVYIAFAPQPDDIATGGGLKLHVEIYLRLGDRPLIGPGSYYDGMADGGIIVFDKVNSDR